MVKVREQHPVKQDGTVDLEKWLDKLNLHLSSDNHAKLSLACHQIEELTAQEFSLSAAEILVSLGMDLQCLICAIIYPSYKNHSIKKEEIEKLFGTEILNLLLGLSKVENISKYQQSDHKKNKSLQNTLSNLQKMLLAVVEDVRVVIIKLAIYTCSMRQSATLTHTEKVILAKECQEIYVPLANRLGIGQIKWELEDLSFKFLEPETYQKIAKLLAEKRIDRQTYISSVTTELKNTLNQQKITANLSGRVKHIYSIWKKMNRKMINYDKIYDARAIRVLVNEVSDCYAVLGIVHTIWQHIPKEFDDYITSPKNNGYQSLHTAVVGPYGKILEVQIRTYDMHQQAEIGIAAHWKYKEGANKDHSLDKKLADLRQLINWQSELTQDKDAADALKTDIFNEKIYVFTPTGDVIELPTGSTPIDFAYDIHTDIGHSCRGAKVNGRIVNINYQLKNGDNVEILTTKFGTPSRDWLSTHLKYIATSKARAKIQQWFKLQDKDKNIIEGKELLSKELKKMGINSPDFKKIYAKIHGCYSEEDLLAGIGNGDIKISQILSIIHNINSNDHNIIESNQYLENCFTKKQNNKIIKKNKEAEINIDGVGNLLCHMARCCKPVPGEYIIGYITLGEGVSVHREDCVNILNIKPEKKSRLIKVNWGIQLVNNYDVNIIIKAYQRRGLLRDITAILSQESADVQMINTVPGKNDYLVEFKLALRVSGIEMLSKILTKLQQITNISDVFRVSG